MTNELMILRRGSMTSSSISFNSLVGIGSNIHVFDLDDLMILEISSSSIVVNESNLSQEDYNGLSDAMI